MNKFDTTPVFEIKMHNFNVIKIYKNGLVEGLPQGYRLILNRIPELIAIVAKENSKCLNTY